VVALRAAGLVLAGGEARRMGGCDKGLLALAGQPLVWHVLQRLRPQVACVLLSANRSLSAYQAYGLPVVTDLPDWQGMGPLAGLASVARVLPAAIDAVQLMPCDTPCLPLDLVSRLAGFLQDNPACPACYPQTPAGPEPGMMLVRRAVLASLDDYLLQGGRSLRGWLSQLAARTVDFADTAAFVNTNDPASLARLEQQMLAAPDGSIQDESHD
jgi:molybdopterin-guanine dinucleotide biosynthesis protein A